MFGLWRRIMNMASKKPDKITGNDCLNNSANKGKLAAANIEDNEIILLKINVSDQIIMVSPRITFNPGILAERPIKTPRVVATPLPPLNFKNTVQLCPHMQLIPVRIQNISGLTLALEMNIAGRNTTGKIPLTISRINTVTPHPVPRSLSALVAPTFPEPNLRISTPLIRRPKI